VPPGLVGTQRETLPKMPALSSAGLARPHTNTPRCQVGVASPTRSDRDKSTRFSTGFFLVSDTSLSNCILYTVLEGPRPSIFLMLTHADHRHSVPSIHPSEVTGDLVRPAKPSVAERSKSANPRRNGMSPGTTAERPEAVARDRPASSGGLPPTWKAERMGRPEGGPSPAVRLRCGAVPRWSA